MTLTANFLRACSVGELIGTRWFIPPPSLQGQPASQTPCLRRMTRQLGFSRSAALAIRQSCPPWSCLSARRWLAQDRAASHASARSRNTHLPRAFAWVWTLRRRSTEPCRALSDPIRWFVIDASAITDIDYSAARGLSGLVDELTRRSVNIVFARVSPYLQSDLERHRIIDVVGENRVLGTLHEAIALATGAAPTADAARVERARKD